MWINPHARLITCKCRPWIVVPISAPFHVVDLGAALDVIGVPVLRFERCALREGTVRVSLPELVTVKTALARVATAFCVCAWVGLGRSSADAVARVYVFIILVAV